jgi:cytochrome c
MSMPRFDWIVVLLAAGLATAASGWWLLGGTEGFAARGEPSAAEAWVARKLRLIAVPSATRGAANPIVYGPEVIRDARTHFADHCAICHANDGSGDTEIGRNLYPPAPDMREETTQSLSDGELFHFIHNGIRFTGMPAWGGGDPARDEDSWKLVHFIRHLPDLTPEEIAEMRGLNPKSPHAIDESRSGHTHGPDPAHDH